MATAESRKPRAERRARSRIPRFKTIEEEAEFWDTHDSADFEDEFEDVTDKVRFVMARPKNSITVQLAEDTLAALTQKALEQGIAPSTLARTWILERLGKQEEPRSSTGTC